MAKAKIEQNNGEEPCKKFKRNDCGLIEGVAYLYHDDNTVNWRAMIKPEYLVINQQYKDKIEQATGKPIAEIQPNEVDDQKLLILLAGIKELAQIRGYSKVNYTIASATPHYVAVSCSIEWIPNYETGMQPVTFSALADASHENTFNWAGNYLAAIAENRAFVRCVRNYLSIHVAGKEEVGPAKQNGFNQNNQNQNIQEEKEFKPTEPHGILQIKLRERNKSFDKLKQDWITKGHEEAKIWQSISDIPINDVWEILTAIKEADSKKKP